MNGDLIVSAFVGVCSLFAILDGDIVSGCMLAALSMFWLNIAIMEGR